MSVKKQNPVQNHIGQDNRISFGFSHLHDVSYTDCKHPAFFGWEKIPIDRVRKAMILTREVSFLLAFRATGNNHVFLGFREGNVFQVVFVESQFGDIYNH